jgi:hypothetical protein
VYTNGRISHKRDLKLLAVPCVFSVSLVARSVLFSLLSRRVSSWLCIALKILFSIFVFFYR